MKWEVTYIDACFLLILAMHLFILSNLRKRIERLEKKVKE